MTRSLWHKIVCAFTTLSLCLALLGTSALQAMVAYAAPANTIAVGGLLFEGDSTKASEWKTLQFTPGEISSTTVPTEDGYEFISAYVPNSDKPKDIFPISKLELNEAGDKVIITPLDGDTNPNVQLYVPTSESAQKIKFLYVNTNVWVKVSYTNNTLDGKGIVTGPKELQIDEASGIGYFTVSVPRNQIPSTPTATNDAKITFNQDLSTPERTVYQYKIETSKDTNITVSSTERETMTVSASANKPNDWKVGFPAGKYADTLIKLPQKTTFKQGETITFNVYHDRVISSPVTFTAYLAALHINGEIFGAPQPFGRYGQAKYEPNPNITVPGYLYKRAPDNKYDANFRRLLENTPWATTSFSAFQGYNPYWVPQPTSNDPAGVRSWWVNQVAKKVIGEETTRYVKSGSLAGATVKIKVLDAIPYMNTRELGEYKPGEEASTRNFTRGAMNNRGTGAEQPWKQNGYGMSLRMAYQVTIENAPSSMEIDTEWAASNNFKIGVYLNHGVENVEVLTSNIGYEARPNPGNIKWRGITRNWIDGTAMPGTTMDPSNQGHGPNPFRVIGNANAELSIRGNVINGYQSPRYVDASEAPSQKGIPNMSLANTAEDGYGWKGKFPLFSVGFDWITDKGWYYFGETNPVNCYGGMNVVGVRADLMNIPAGYDMDGASIPGDEESLFPSLDTASAKTLEASVYKYNVESNPIIQVPRATPTKVVDGTPRELLFWNLYRKSGDTLTKVEKTYLPGADIDIRDEDEVGGRLSDAQGNALVDSFVLKPVFSGGANLVKDDYVIKKELYKDNNLLTSEDVAEFAGAPGLYAQLNETLAPESVEYEGNSYGLKNAPENMSVLLGKDKNLMTLRYEYLTDAERYTPETTPITVVWGQTPTEDELKNNIKVVAAGSKDKTALPQGSSVSIESGFNPQAAGAQEVTVKIVYPDNTSETVTMNITVKDNRTDAQKWQDDNNTKTLTAVPTTFDWGHEVTDADIKALVQQSATLPADATYTVNPTIDTKPTKADGRSQNPTVTVTFPDKSTMTVEVPVTIKPANESFTPEAQNIDAALGETLGASDARGAISNADTLPEGTTFSFKDPVDTQSVGDKDATVVVTYPDGTTTEVPVKVTVTSAAEKWTKLYGGLEGDLKNFEYGSQPTDTEKLGLVKHTEQLEPLVKSVVYEQPLDTKPTTVAGHMQSIKVTVTFKDGSQLSTPDGKFATAFISYLSSEYNVTADPIRVPMGDQPTDKQLKDALKVASDLKLPEGTVVSLKDAPVDTSTEGTKNITIHILYPDGTSTDVPDTIEVYDNSDAARYTPEVTDVQVGYGDAIPDLTKAISNMDDLPSGTKLVPHTEDIDTSKPGEQHGSVTVIYPDGSEETVDVPVDVKTAADTFDPKTKPLKVQLDQNVGNDSAVDTIANAGSLPKDTKYEFVTPVDTSTTGTHDVQVKITYPDGSSETVTTQVVVGTMADRWEHDHGSLTGKDHSFAYGSNVTADDLKSLIKDGDQLTNVQSITTEPAIDTTPDSADARTQHVTVTVTFTDGSSLTTSVDNAATASIEPASDAYKLSAKPFDVNIFNQPTADQMKNALTDADGKVLPEGTQVAVKGGKVDTDTAGDKSFTIVVTYPDGSVQEVPAQVTVIDNRDSARYEPEIAPIEVGYGDPVPDLKDAVTNKADLPADTQYTSDVAGIDTTKPGKQTGQLTITYPDGSTDTVTVPVVVKSAADTFDPKAADPITVDFGHELDSDDAEAAVVTDGLPEGTTYHFKEPVDTSAAGTKDAVVVIAYPDGSTTEVPVQVNVRTEAETWLEHYGKDGKIDTQSATYPWGAEITQDALKNLLADPSNLPAGVTITTEPDINTTPDSKAGQTQDVKVIITFADGSRAEGDVVVTIADKPKPPADVHVRPGGLVATGDVATAGVAIASLMAGSALVVAGLKRRKH